jgi:uncharacterized protein YciI
MSESRQFLYTVRPVRKGMLTDGPSDQEDEIIAEHFHYLSTLAAKGVVEFAGRTDTHDEKTFGIVVFHAHSETDALRIMQSDPAVSQGIMRAELFPFHLAISTSQ